MDPVTAGLAAVAVISAVSGLAQAWQQKQAIKGQENEMKRIKAAFDALKPPELDINIEDPPELIANSVPPVDYNWGGISPELFEVVGEYAPEQVPYIAEAAPQLVKDSAVGQEGLGAQTAALSQLRKIASGGIDPQFAQRMKDAAQSSQMAAQSRQESLMQDYARRGMLGSGTQLASEIGGAEGAMSRGAQQSSDAASQAYLNQLGALRDSASLGGNIRGQELDLASKNAAIANSFNQRTSAAFQNFLQRQADTRNQAAVENLNRKQSASDANVQAANTAQRYNTDRGDRNLESRRSQQQQNISGANEAALGNWANRIKAGDIKAAREQQMFNNQLSKVQGASGQARDMANVIGQRGQTDANVISGIGQGATTAVLANQEMKQRELDREHEKDLFGRP